MGVDVLTDAERNWETETKDVDNEPSEVKALNEGESESENCAQTMPRGSYIVTTQTVPHYYSYILSSLAIMWCWVGTFSVSLVQLQL